MPTVEIPSPFNLAAYVLAAGACVPDKVALSLISPGAREDWSFEALIAAVRGTATGLLAAGLKPGDKVLMRLGNTPDFPLAYLGALAAGLVAVPTSAALTEEEVARIVKTLDPQAVLRDPAVACPEGERCIPLDALRAMRDLPAAPWHMGDPERVGYIIYTSGTSGNPSAVMHAHRAILARQLMFDGWYGLRAQDRMLHAGAFNWTYTLGTGLMDPWTMGATTLIPAPGTSPGALPAIIAEHGASIFAAAPGVYRQMLKSSPRFEAPQLRHGLSAGEKLSSSVRQDWMQATDTPIYEAFGMSECSTFISGSPALPAKDGALGCAQRGRKVAILGANGAQPAGVAGTIAVHQSDPGLMLGYHSNAKQTAARYRGPWFLTGDEAVMDEDGQITYLGRKDDMMNAGGFRVSPLEVEAALGTAPGVQAIAVTQIPIKQDVQVIAAFYTAQAALDEATLHRYAEAKLARYKQPRLYVHLPALPHGANGKLQRRALGALYEALSNDQPDQT